MSRFKARHVMGMDAPFNSHLKAVLGPTNTGKTWYAIDRMLAYPSGMIGLPLRLLAREVYQTVVRRVGVQAVALVTGEERIVPATARYWVATVEAMPTDLVVDCVAIDEIQTAVDFDRGHVFTNRLLNARGRSETLLLGAATMAPVIRTLLPEAEIIYRPRLSQLTYAGSKKITRQPPRSAIVAFSAAQVYAIAELVRRERGGAAVVMGALSPRTRNAQVELYQNGDVDFLVATDAVGMGLNLDVQHVAFADDMKFDGRQSRPLTPAELGQIAGRAGRHLRNGTFGVTGGTAEFDEEMIQRLEGHDFEPVRVLQWRNDDLDFASITALRDSLDATPGHRNLTRVPVATDQQTLEFLARNEAAGLAHGREAVRLLWDCCQIPDYRDVSPAQHGEIVTRIYTDLRRRGHVDADWIADQIRFCDNTSGDIDTLSNRIKQIRTWTFVANRRNWLEDPTHWREKTRDIEDRLSDALHERLIARFVDRRTSVLLRHLKDRRMVSPEINERGEVSVEGHPIGTIEGFRFTLLRSEGDDPKGLRAAATQVVAPEIVNRAVRMAGAPNEEFVLASDGRLRWRGEIVAELAEGDSIFNPRILVLADDSLNGPELERVQERLGLWLRHAINTLLEPVIALLEPAELEGAPRGIAFQIAEHLGVLPRSAVAEDVKALDQDVRGKMRKLGIKFGAYHLYLPLALKPAPRELALILFALKNGGVRQPGVSELPHIVLSGRTSIEVDPAISPRLYEVAGFKVAGKRAVRVDILERLADIIRPLIALDPKRHEGTLPAGAAEANGFRVTVEMTSLLGCSGEDFNSVLSSLGYRLRRTPKVVAVTEVAPAAAEASTHDEDAASAVEAGAGPSDGSGAAAEVTMVPDAAAEQSDSAAGEAATLSVEAGSTAPGEDQQAVVAAAADLTPVAATAGKAETAEAAEPQFDEVWFPGGRRDGERREQRGGPRRQGAPGGRNGAEGEGAADGAPPQHRHRSRPNRQAPNGDAGAPALATPGEQRPRPEGRREFKKPDFRPREDFKPRDEQRNGKAPRQPDKSFESKPRPKERTYDPDSPFAALAALRDRKTE